MGFGREEARAMRALLSALTPLLVGVLAGLMAYAGACWQISGGW